MEKFFEAISLGLLLRWGIAGALAIGAFALTSGQIHHGLVEVIKHGLFVPLLVSALLYGAVLYGVYRSSVYPYVSHRALEFVDRACLEAEPPYRREFEHMLVLWDSNRNDDHHGVHTNRHKRITSWGDIAHSQMVGGIGVIVNALAGFAMSTVMKASLPDWLDVLVLIVLLVIGFLYFNIGEYAMRRLLFFQRFIDRVAPDRPLRSMDAAHKAAEKGWTRMTPRACCHCCCSSSCGRDSCSGNSQQRSDHDCKCGSSSQLTGDQMFEVFVESRERVYVRSREH